MGNLLKFHLHLSDHQQNYGKALGLTPRALCLAGIESSQRQGSAAIAGLPCLTLVQNVARGLS